MDKNIEQKKHKIKILLFEKKRLFSEVQNALFIFIPGIHFHLIKGTNPSQTPKNSYKRCEIACAIHRMCMCM